MIPNGILLYQNQKTLLAVAANEQRFSSGICEQRERETLKHSALKTLSSLKAMSSTNASPKGSGTYAEEEVDKNNGWFQGNNSAFQI